MIHNKLRSIINNYPYIILAVSGGSDSMAMLHWFIANVDNSKIVVINVEHGIRGADSQADSDMVIKYCIERGIAIHAVAVNVPLHAAENKLTIEQAARELRRDVYRQARARYDGSVVATAHHASDQSETLLMNIFRGCGIRGLSGINIEADDGIIHPLLMTTKADIMAYIEANNVPYRSDDTNNDTDYMRNFIRCKVIPIIKERYPALDNSLAKMAAHAADTHDFIQSMLSDVEMSYGGVNIAKGRHKVIIAEEIRRAARVLGVYADIETRHIELCIDMCNGGRNGAMLQLPYGIEVYNEYNSIVVAKTCDKDNAEYPLVNMPTPTKIGGYSISIVEKNGGYGIFSLAQLPSGAVVRTRKQGDYMQLSAGRKSLGDIMTDRKIPSRLRDNLPLIAKGSEVYVLADILASSSCNSGGSAMHIEYINR